MNKGSPNKAIKHLLNVNPESKLNNDLKELQNDVMALQDKFERLINLNKQLRF
jgi:hypothetical protein